MVLALAQATSIFAEVRPQDQIVESLVDSIEVEIA